MKLPSFDLAFLPDLDTLTGVFGSFMAGPGHDDTIVIMATFVFEATGG